MDVADPNGDEFLVGVTRVRFGRERPQRNIPMETIE